MRGWASYHLINRNKLMLSPKKRNAKKYWLTGNLARGLDMKPSKVYLEAARRIAEREDSFSCIAIKHVVHDGNHSYTKVPLARDYKNIFGFTDEDNFKREIERDNDGRNLRVLLLCLAA